jgi:hypothetical protein
MRRTKPLAVGYVRERITDSPVDHHDAFSTLARFAQDEGYALAEVFYDADPNRPDNRLAAMLRFAGHRNFAAIILSSSRDLAAEPAAAATMLRRIRTDMGIPVLIVEGAERARTPTTKRKSPA